MRKAAQRVRPAVVAQRYALPLPEAAWKNVQQERATITMPSEKELATDDGEGGAGDIPGYISTGEGRRTQDMYRDWVQFSYGVHLSGV